MGSRFVKIEILKAEGAARDCTVGKVYEGLRAFRGDKLGEVRVTGPGVTFFDDANEQCAIKESLGLYRIVSE